MPADPASNPADDPLIRARQDWMSVLAKAPGTRLAAVMEALGPEPAHSWLRAPEFGAVMSRGRAGATGAPFNLGEITVTRCSLRLEDGTVGHAYIAGRDADHARRAALCDALLQGPRAAELQATVIAPLRADLARAAAEAEARADKTRVDFFTMVRGE
ncbi:MAG: phosphonate C-P lyase system protein PhnG [Pseudomonadota bacterium]